MRDMIFFGRILELARLADLNNQGSQQRHRQRGAVRPPHSAYRKIRSRL